MISALKRVIFKKYSPGAIFAFKKGIMIGKMIVFVVDQKLDKDFLIIPDLMSYSIEKNEFKNYIETGLLDFVENLPNDVFEVVKAQYLKNIKTV
jgi:hypothetical protein